MTSGGKTIAAIIFAVFFIVILGGLQIAFINSFNWGFNAFLILVSLLVFNKNIYGAFFLGWFGGFLIDTVHFSAFGASSLLLLLLAAFLTIFQKKALIPAKNENMVIMGIAAVFFYHLFEWLINIPLISRRETFDFYFLNYGFAFELLLTTFLLMAILYFKNRSVVNV